MVLPRITRVNLFDEAHERQALGHKRIVIPIQEGYAIEVVHHPAHWSMACSVSITLNGVPVEGRLDMPFTAAERDQLADALRRPT